MNTTRDRRPDHQNNRPGIALTIMLGAQLSQAPAGERLAAQPGRSR